MKTVAWLALIIAVIALILGWVAYNRTGVNLDQQIQNAVSSALENTGDAMNNAGDAMNDAGDAMDNSDAMMEEGTTTL